MIELFRLLMVGLLLVIIIVPLLTLPINFNYTCIVNLHIFMLLLLLLLLILASICVYEVLIVVLVALKSSHFLNCFSGYFCLCFQPVSVAVESDIIGSFVIIVVIFDAHIAIKAAFQSTFSYCTKRARTNTIWEPKCLANHLC